MPCNREAKTGIFSLTAYLGAFAIVTKRLEGEIRVWGVRSAMFTKNLVVSFHVAMQYVQDATKSPPSFDSEDEWITVEAL